MLTLQENSLNWALNHTLKYGDTDIFPLPFEYEALNHDWSNIRTWLKEQDILGWQVRPHRTLLSPKAKHGFRVITQLDPLDFLIFAATLKEIASDIEANRISINQNIVFSYRVAVEADGQLFNLDVGYEAFLNQTQSLLQDDSINFIAVTDKPISTQAAIIIILQLECLLAYHGLGIPEYWIVDGCDKLVSILLLTVLIIKLLFS